MGLTLEQPTSTVIDGVSWETYLALTADAGPGTRITYDRGRMEIMPPISMGHERRSSLLTLLFLEYLRVNEIWFEKIATTTLRREVTARGAEPDDAYYLVSDPPPPDADELDLSIHNPPDLVIEIDLSSRSIDKEPLYAAFGVAELWRLDGDELRIRRLNPEKNGYVGSPASGLLPKLPVAALAEHVRLGRTVPQHEIVARWRKVLEA